MRPCSARAWPDLAASVRTSSATTEKPFPAVPARAASTAAFRARMLVWEAISSMVLMMVPICAEDWSMLVVEIHAGVHVHKHVLAVGQALDAQVQQGVHQAAGIDPRPHIADALLVLKNGAYMDRIMLPVPGDFMMPRLVSSRVARLDMSRYWHKNAGKRG